MASQEEENPEVRAILNEGSQISDETALKYFDDCVARIIKEGEKKRKIELAKAYDSEKDEGAKQIIIMNIAQSNKK